MLDIPSQLSAYELLNAAHQRLFNFRSLHKANELSPPIINSLAKNATSSIISYFQLTSQVLSDAVTLLCEIASLPSLPLAQIGTKYLFSDLVEKLNDSFEEPYCKLYDQLFSQVIQFCRTLPEGELLHKYLNSFGLLDQNTIYERKLSLSNSFSKITPRHVKKVIILSRITIGADIAVTSIILSGLEKFFPDANIILICLPKLYQLFGGDQRLRFRYIEYGRHSGLLSRLNTWINVVDIVREETFGLEPSEYLIIDPDSRLTQLGLLPLVPPEIEPLSYFFFESRTYQHPHARKLGELTLSWINSTFSESITTYPYISIPPQFEVGSIVDDMRGGSKDSIVSMSFGVGDNPRKRLDSSFELRLVDFFCQESKVIIDKGVSPNERMQVNLLLEQLYSSEYSIIHLNEANYRSYSKNDFLEADIVTWEGGIGGFASLIARTDKFIGYDSSGQHIAAALSVPTIDIFLNYNSSLFAQRWQPFGRSPVLIISANVSNISPALLADQVLEHIKDL